MAPIYVRGIDFSVLPAAACLARCMVALVIIIPGSLVTAGEVQEGLERTGVLRDLAVETPAAQVPLPAAAELPAARLQGEARQATEVFRLRQSGDARWRQLLGAQQMRKHLPAPSGAPAAAAAGRALGADIENRMQDLAGRIRGQDFKYRLDR